MTDEEVQDCIDKAKCCSVDLYDKYISMLSKGNSAAQSFMVRASSINYFIDRLKSYLNKKIAFKYHKKNVSLQTTELTESSSKCNLTEEQVSNMINRMRFLCC